jgi:hypothetical protein
MLGTHDEQARWLTPPLSDKSGGPRERLDQ